jgi:hypothetical protein
MIAKATKLYNDVPWRIVKFTMRDYSDELAEALVGEWIEGGEK